MRTGQQLWNHGDWMLKAFAERNRKQRKKHNSQPEDIFKYGVRLRDNDFVGYNRNTGKILFEAESYDEARNVLNELYGEN